MIKRLTFDNPINCEEFGKNNMLQIYLIFINLSHIYTYSKDMPWPFQG